MKSRFSFLIISLLIIIHLFGQNHDTNNTERIIDRWLIARSIEVYLPADNNENNLNGETLKPIDLIKSSVHSFDNPEKDQDL